MSEASENLAESGYDFGMAIAEICIAHGIRFESKILEFHTDTTLMCKGEPCMKHLNDDYGDNYCNVWGMDYRMNQALYAGGLNIMIYHQPYRVFSADEEDGYDEEMPCKIKIKVGVWPEHRHVLRGVFPDGASSVKFVGYEDDARDALELIRKIVARVAENRNFIAKVRARKIQKAWSTAISNPQYFICRRRLLREFDEMVGVLREWYAKMLELRQ